MTRPRADARRIPGTRLAAAALIAAAALAGAAPPARGGGPPAPTGTAPVVGGECGVCHPSERVLYEKSSHAQEGVRCTACHGGNDRSLEVAGAHANGFVGKPARKEVPRLCASCHADERKMRPYNLPVDQYALYQTSGHGRRLAQGDGRVATCPDCHGAHDILPPSDPASRVFLTNIPRTCGGCHGDAKIVGVQRARIYEQYRASIHGRELLDRGNPRAPACVNCHGVHGAAPPAMGDVDKVCGRCHTAENRYFVSGPHGTVMAGAGLQQCTSCHGDHGIQAADPAQFAGTCTRCHPARSPQADLGRRILADYRVAAGELAKAGALMARADQVPLDTEDYRARLEEARTYLREAMPASHAVREEVVQGFTTRAGSVGAEIQTDIRGKLERLKARRFVLIVFWFYLLLTILVLRRFQVRGAKTD